MLTRNPVISVTLMFNYNDGRPIWSVPTKIVVPHGAFDTIHWHLACRNLPPGGTGRFALSQPINFKTAKDGATGAEWKGPTPVRVNDTLVTLDDDNRHSAGETKHYFYTVKVDVVVNGVVTTFECDPEVQNPGN